MATTPARKKVERPQTGKRGDRTARELQAALKPEVPCFPWPDDLPEEQRATWTDIVNTKTCDYWTRGDLPLLRMYCRCVADVERLTNEIMEEGELIRNAKGNAVVNPKAVLRGFAEARLMTLATKLRMQPSSRVDPKTETRSNVRKKAAEDAARTINGEMGVGDDGLLAGSATLN